MVSTTAVALLLAAPLAGSFLATAARRLPEDLRGLALGRSCCDGCGAALAVRDLVCRS